MNRPNTGRMTYPLIFALMAAWPTQAGELVGKFMDASRSYEIPYADLALCPVGSETCLHATTDANGVFAFRDVTPGEYVLRLPGKTGEAERPVTIGSGREVLEVFSD